MIPDNEKIVSRIDSLAKSKGTSIAEIERNIGFGNGKIGKWKKAPKSPPFESLLSVANYLETNISYLTGETDDPSAGIKKDPIPKDGAEDSETAELREIWSSADENERRDLLEMARMLKNRRKQNG
jgi:transcriptional regulator with XRE-family HTH domain